MSLRYLELILDQRPGRVWLHPEHVLALAIGGILATLVVPLPSPVLDVLMASNIAFAVLVLVSVLAARGPLSLSSFPTLLLLTTLFRLALNVSSTRMILTEARAGEVVVAFGRFVARGDVVTGLVVFFLLTLVQLLVIGKGAERVAEVGARFTLDALPGKQMSIDAALRSGALSDARAEARREELARESQFHGAMDGAMKFVKGDAIVGVIVTLLNLIAGLFVGIFRLDLAPIEAAELFAVLTIGDGLVSQIPALVIALAAGILTTRVTTRGASGDLGRLLRRELFDEAHTLGWAGLFAMMIGWVPGLPALPFTAIGLAFGLGAVARAARRRHRRAAGDSPDDSPGSSLEGTREGPETTAARAPAASDRLAPTVLPLVIELSPSLAQAMSLGTGRDSDAELFRNAIPHARDYVAATTGVRLPAVKARIAEHLDEDAICLRVNEVPVAYRDIRRGAALALAPAEKLRRLGLEADESINPITGRPAAWIPGELGAEVAAMGISVHGPEEVVMLHLGRIGCEHAHRFLGLEEVAQMMKRLQTVAPELVAEVFPRRVGLGLVRDVLRRLVSERVNVRDLKSIVEALGEVGDRSSDFVALIEHVRRALGPQIAHSVAGPHGRVSAILVESQLEETILDAVVDQGLGLTLGLEPDHRRSLVRAFERAGSPLARVGAPFVVLAHSPARFFIQELLMCESDAHVLSYEELPPDTHILPVGRVDEATFEPALVAARAH